MAEKHRLRKNQFLLRLVDEEMNLLEEKASLSGVTKTEYLRMLIAYGGVKGSGITNYTKEDAKKLRYELSSIGNNVNQIAYRANSNSMVRKEDIDELRENFVELIGVLHNYVTG
jgi:diketogulonate reductase-like aldo/keto reductase